MDPKVTISLFVLQKMLVDCTRDIDVGRFHGGQNDVNIGFGGNASGGLFDHFEKGSERLRGIVEPFRERQEVSLAGILIER